MAFVGLEDDTLGYSASPRLIETGPEDEESIPPIAPITLAAPGMMRGKPEPGMLFPTGTVFTPYTVLHNISDRPLTVALSLTF